MKKLFNKNAGEWEVLQDNDSCLIRLKPILLILEYGGIKKVVWIYVSNGTLWFPVSFFIEFKYTKKKNPFENCLHIECGSRESYINDCLGRVYLPAVSRVRVIQLMYLESLPFIGSPEALKPQLLNAFFYAFNTNVALRWVVPNILSTGLLLKKLFDLNIEETSLFTCINLLESNTYYGGHLYMFSGFCKKNKKFGYYIGRTVIGLCRFSSHYKKYDNVVIIKWYFCTKENYVNAEVLWVEGFLLEALSKLLGASTGFFEEPNFLKSFDLVIKYPEASRYFEYMRIASESEVLSIQNSFNFKYLRSS